MVSQFGEDQLVERLTKLLSTSERVVVGPGQDDCAVVALADNTTYVQLLKTDVLVESIHFLPGTDPIAVGRKAICRAISDIAASGGHPEYALITLAVDDSRSLGEIEGWYRGMQQAATEFGGIDIVGGETTSLPNRGALISVSMTGIAKNFQFISRTGGLPHDKLFVTGRLGGSFNSERHLHFTPRLKQGQWLSEHKETFNIHAMMDLSDGLAKDLPRLADSSGLLGYEIDLTTLPINSDSNLEAALGEGEDYELLFSASDETILDSWHSQFPDLELTMIGEFTKKNANRTDLTGGWDHFKPNPR